ncbi:MAG: hypothetical protein O4859_16835 [Trichodesmium sp. St18_bin1]|nr:hypothetical protein [Trichodesmium sp. St18_bin1]MDE5124240.1 hypothetical protein [Trichodesmium sp. St19_bin1]
MILVTVALELSQFFSNHKYRFSGYDVRRELYKASNGLKYNADVNGSLNILRKAVPNAFSNGIMGVVVHPVMVTLN